MSQTARHSLFESLANIAVGYVLAVLVNWVTMPWYGLDATLAQANYSVMMLTVVSLARSYALRRLFNKLAER